MLTMSVGRPPWIGGTMAALLPRSVVWVVGPAMETALPGLPTRSASAPQPPPVTIRRRCGHEEQIAYTDDPWLRWAHEQQRCARCTAAWLARPQCEGRCSTGLLDPSNDQL